MKTLCDANAVNNKKNNVSPVKAKRIQVPEESIGIIRLARSSGSCLQVKFVLPAT